MDDRQHNGKAPPAATPLPATPPEVALRYARKARQSLDLVVLSGPDRGTRHPIYDGMVLGRGVDVDVQIPDRRASRRHLKLSVGPAGVSLKDLGSHNGTLVNGAPVRETTLNDGDTLRIGDTEVSVSLPPPNEASGQADGGTGPHTGVGGGWPAGVISTRTLERVDIDQRPFERAVTNSPVDAPESLRSIADRHPPFAVLYGLCHALGCSGTLDELLGDALEHLCRVTDAHRGHLLLLPAESGELERTVVRTRGQGDRSSRDLSRTIIEWVVRNRTAVVTADAQGDERFADGDSLRRLDLRSTICTPLLGEDGPLGVLQLDRLGEVGPFDDEALELTVTVAPVLALAIRNLRLDEDRTRTISRLQHTQRELIAAQQELVAREKLAAIGKMSASLSHELTNALAPFELLTLLHEECAETPDARQDIAVMLDAYRRLTLVAEEVRLLSLGERTNLDSLPQDPRVFVQSMAVSVRRDPTVARHRLELALEGVPNVQIDPSRMQQVLVNLVRNAAQSMLDVGTITIRCRVDPVDAKTVLLEVVDEGAGIPPHVKARMWEPFFTTRGAEGAGLGLDVSRRIVELHGGTIECRTVKDVGTTMIVRLPAVE